MKRHLAAPVARDIAKLFNDKTADMDSTALGIGFADPVVPDERTGHRDKLTAVGGIGKNLLITRHRGVETDFTSLRRRGTERNAVKHSPVLEREDCFFPFSTHTPHDPACKKGLGRMTEKRGVSNGLSEQGPWRQGNRE